MTIEHNPYEAPKAALPDLPDPSGRPGWVWVIVIFYALGIVGTLISTIAVLAGRPLGGQAASSYLSNLTTLDHVFSLIVASVSALGTIALFRMKRRALHFLLAVFLLSVANFGINVALRPAYRAMFDQVGYWGLIAGWAINIAIVLYVWRLQTKGLLRA